jgi:polysaccharide deacetylase family protein (PEP-CTERM system associated)
VLPHIAAATNAFSIDLEDWFHSVGHGPGSDIAGWASLPSRVQPVVETLLALLDRHRARATFFVLGWIAERHPRLIAAIADRGHEIASHGYAHRCVFDQDRPAFIDDLARAEDAIDRAAGVRPLGYRAPGFSITQRSLWALDVLAERGYLYDSSVFPAARGTGGLPGAAVGPVRLRSGLVEIPVSTTRLSGERFAFLGGGYLRVLPLAAIVALANRQRAAGLPLVLHCHPHDVDADQPRLDLPPLRAFTRYVGVAGCLAKLDRLLATYGWGPCASLANAVNAAAVPAVDLVATAAPHPARAGAAAAGRFVADAGEAGGKGAWEKAA